MIHIASMHFYRTAWVKILQSNDLVSLGAIYLYIYIYMNMNMNMIYCFIVYVELR